MSSRRAGLAPALFLVAASGCASAPPASSGAALREEVFATERAFAKTMADRDHAAFRSFLSEETVFFSGEKAIRGPEAVATHWKKYYEGKDAPFSWGPAQVEVLDSGTLALSTGLVREPDGRVSGTFTSIWRREGPGKWRIVFDKGGPVCAPEP